MFFGTPKESASWIVEIGEDPARWSGPVVDQQRPGSVHVAFAKSAVASVAIARRIVDWLGDYNECLLLITEYGIWPSHENLHLYYRLRASYGDTDRLRTAPGHFFLGHERAELASFLDLTLSFGWGGHALTAPFWTGVSISHDGWFVVESEKYRPTVIRDLESIRLTYRAR